MPGFNEGILGPMTTTLLQKGYVRPSDGFSASDSPSFAGLTLTGLLSGTVATFNGIISAYNGSDYISMVAGTDSYIFAQKGGVNYAIGFKVGGPYYDASSGTVTTKTLSGTNQITLANSFDTIQGRLSGGGVGIIDVRADNGFRVRNLANSADAPMSASTGTFSGALTLGTSGILVGGTNIIEQRNGASSQTFRQYAAYTDASNYARFQFRSYTDATYITMPSVGTVLGTTWPNAEFHIQTRGTGAVYLEANGGLYVMDYTSVSYTPITCGSVTSNSTISGLYTGASTSGALFVGDVNLYRDASNTLAMRNPGSPQSFRMYGSYTDSTNYERIYLTSGSGNYFLGSSALGAELAAMPDANWTILARGNGIVKTRATGGLSVRNTGDSADAPISASTGKFSTSVGIKETVPDYDLDVNGTFGFTPGASVTPVDNGDVVIEATNNTTLTFKLKGSDGVVRTATLTLA